MLYKIGHLHTELYTLYLASFDSRVAWYVKALMVLVLVYVISPVDFIPDFSPVLGYIDDILMMPLGLYLVMKLIPAGVKQECREKALSDLKNARLRTLGVFLVILAWLLLLILVIALLFVL